uniref:Uncharacterized protein n=1 Tax=Ananas comosus var. bracteatus TaxID=296719 RepID=A0A6V7Q433_ANACO|nr:unnamed protein product [Ananas comosus var. bracteatus]
MARRSGEGRMRQQQRRGWRWRQRRGWRLRHRVGCGPLAAAAAECGVAERRTWDVAATTARVAAATRVEGSGEDPGTVGSDGEEEERGGAGSKGRRTRARRQRGRGRGRGRARRRGYSRGRSGG